MSRRTRSRNAAWRPFQLFPLMGLLILTSLPVYPQSVISSPCWETKSAGKRGPADRLEERGYISELRERHRFVVLDSGLPNRAPNYQNSQRDQLIRRQVEQELARYTGLTVAADAASADLFVVVMIYPEVPTTSVSSNILVFIRGQRQADGCYARRYVWQGHEFQSALSPAIELNPTTIALNVTNRFIQDLKKVRGEK